jgi:hypothetical protein
MRKCNFDLNCSSAVLRGCWSDAERRFSTFTRQGMVISRQASNKTLGQTAGRKMDLAAGPPHLPKRFDYLPNK